MLCHSQLVICHYFLPFIFYPNSRIMERKQLLTSKELDVILHRLACQLIENHTDFSDTVLIGLQPRGVFLAQRLVAMLGKEYQVAGIQYGALDITFFRDDFRRGEKPLAANTTDIPFLVEDKKVVFIDDVLYTGRSIRAALTALQSFGRPSKVELLVLIDRRFRKSCRCHQQRASGCQLGITGRRRRRLSHRKTSIETTLPIKHITMNQLSVNHLLGIKYLTPEDIELIFTTADQFKEVINRPIKKVPSLRDITIANLFFENSTRTRLSFELAEKRLSADVINFSAAQSSVKKGETLIDTVNNILAMKVDMVVMRHPNPGAGVFLSQHVKVPIVNAGDGAHEHPTQALLDSYSIRERLGSVKGKKIVIVADILHSRVALSNIFALHMQGAEVAVCGPKTLIPKYIHELGVRVETDLKKALQWCDVANMLRIQNERLDIPYFPSTREYVQQYGLTQQILEEIGREIIIMHPGPINRGVELTSEVADGPQSVILDQVENGVAIRMAVIYLLASQIKMQ